MFTISCKLNVFNQEIFDKLKQLGYKITYNAPVDCDNRIIVTNAKKALVSIINELDEIPDNIIDCDNNEELFFALVALQNDSNVNQFMVVHNDRETLYKFDTKEQCKEFIQSNLDKKFYVHKLDEYEILDKFDKRDFGWLTYSAEFVDACCNDTLILFMPTSIEIVDSYDETTWDIENPIKLTEAGRELCDQYFNDYSVGYDLCNGKAKGLAGRWKLDEFFDMIKETKEYRII